MPSAAGAVRLGSGGTLSSTSSRGLSDAEVVQLLRREFARELRRARRRKRQAFLDLFAGSGGVARAIRDRGFACVAFDLAAGPQYDLTRRCVKGLIEEWLRTGRVLGVVCATPCGTWSAALRVKPMPDSGRSLRSRDHIWGLPNLSAHERSKVKAGNATLRAAVRIVKACVAASAPAIVENPVGSLLFFAPPMQKLMGHPAADAISLDQCQFGTPWRKRTRLVGWHVPSLEDSALLCQGSGGLCSATGRPHLVISGRHPDGAQWGPITQEYPEALCSAIADALVDSADTRKRRD